MTEEASIVNELHEKENITEENATADTTSVIEETVVTEEELNEEKIEVVNREYSKLIEDSLKLYRDGIQKFDVEIDEEGVYDIRYLVKEYMHIFNDLVESVSEKADDFLHEKLPAYASQEMPEEQRKNIIKHDLYEQLSSKGKFFLGTISIDSVVNNYQELYKASLVKSMRKLFLTRKLDAFDVDLSFDIKDHIKPEIWEAIIDTERKQSLSVRDILLSMFIPWLCRYDNLTDPQADPLSKMYFTLMNVGDGCYMSFLNNLVMLVSPIISEVKHHTTLDFFYFDRLLNIHQDERTKCETKVNAVREDYFKELSSKYK